MKRKGTIFVISSPSGGGKTTICRKLLKELPELNYSISTTSRSPRPGEKEGKDYFFISGEEFSEKIRKSEFAEWAKVHGHGYGTPRQFLEEALRSGRDIILDIDVKGALQIKEKYKESRLIFLLPPSLETLAARLKKRKTDDGKEIEKRLARAQEEMAFLKEYDYAVVNRNLSQAVKEVKAIITAERCRALA
ncbi:guanylate kinase, partial [candidate division NPL-UPA2 bacterium]|nr:guanylate kinase [candidate division NPL-UPA2 bacterium]